MIFNKPRLRSLLQIGFIPALIFFSVAFASAQESSKDIRSAELFNRPAPSGGLGGSTVVVVKPSQTYHSNRPVNRRPPLPAMEHVTIGVTVWRLPDDPPEGSKELKQKGEEAVEQVAADTQLAIGNKVRLGIEPLNRGGYLYVIDREQFADGSYGTPLLIFPTLRTRQGNNEVKRHVLIQIPAAPSYFEINPSSGGKRQVAEVLTIILSTQPLTLPTALGNKAMALNAEQFKRWETSWGTEVEELELAGGSGQITKIKVQPKPESGEGSKSLDQKGDEPLTQADPLPQTVLRVTVKRGNPLLVTVPLRFETSPGEKKEP